MSTFNRTPLIWIIVALVALVGVAAWITNPTLVLAALPFLLIVACPLIMMFMMGGMGHGNMHGNMSEPEGLHGSAVEDTPDLAGLSRDEQVRELRQELTRMAWRQEALRQDIEQLNAGRKDEQVVDAENPAGAR